jgi:hypothetical protein
MSPFFVKKSFMKTLITNNLLELFGEWENDLQEVENKVTSKKKEKDKVRANKRYVYESSAQNETKVSYVFTKLKELIESI